MTKKLKRRRVEPTVTEPKLPQSTWAHSPGGKLQHQEGGFAHRAHQADKLLEDAVAAGIALGLELLEDLLGGVRMTFQQRDDLALERVELAGAFGALALLIAGPLHPLGDGPGIQFKFRGDLGGGQMLLIQELSKLAEDGVIDHGRPPAKARRRMSPTD